MRIISLLIFGLFYSFKGYSQPPLNVAENFENNNYMWEVPANEKADCKIENGIYTIDHHPANEEGQYYFRDFIVDDSKDFTIEMKVRFISGSTNNGYGLHWGANGWKNSNTIILSGNQFYKVQHYDGETRIDDVPWTKDSITVKPVSEFNVIRVQRTGQAVKITVNEVEIATVNYKSFTGNKIGFYISKPMKVEVDYLHIYQYGDANINLINNAINGYQKENLGKNVNGVFSDRSPLISTDGNTLYYIKEDYEDIATKRTEIYFSTQLENGDWTPAQNIGSPLNNDGGNSVINVSADGNTFILSNTYNEDGTSKGAGMSISKRTETGWEIPRDIKIDDYYNTSKYNSNCLSSNKKVLITGVTRKDTYGEQDLYVCFKNDSMFSQPLNMGSILNTKGDDVSPFLAPDDKTLYFSSNGHPGYGSNDIFVSRRLDDTWTNWSKPQNLGPEINSDNWDAYFSVTAKGDYGYLVSSGNSFGKEDIFRIKVPEAAKPLPITLIKGKVLNAKTKESVFAEIYYQNLKTGEEVGRALSDPITGDYQIVLPSGVMYGFLAEKKDFYPVSNFVDATTIAIYNEVNYDLLLTPIEVGENIRLNNLFFDTDKAELKDISISELDRLVKFLKDNPTIKIEIGGHTDNVGAPAYNQILSEKRAKSVMNYLITKDIEANRLIAKGYGLTKPITANRTEEEKAVNRRVEMKILAK